MLDNIFYESAVLKINWVKIKHLTSFHADQNEPSEPTKKTSSLPWFYCNIAVQSHLQLTPLGSILSLAVKFANVQNFAHIKVSTFDWRFSSSKRKISLSN